VADAGGLDLDQDLAGPRAFELHSHDFERFAGLNGNSGAYIHGDFLIS
jgi:hypothetical protein